MLREASPHTFVIPREPFGSAQGDRGILEALAESAPTGAPSAPTTRPGDSHLHFAAALPAQVQVSLNLRASEVSRVGGA